eukprot:2631626-Pleurochrysis_carterae.AAC.1
MLELSVDPACTRCLALRFRVLVRDNRPLVLSRRGADSDGQAGPKARHVCSDETFMSDFVHMCCTRPVEG